jgi:hypothetical protein
MKKIHTFHPILGNGISLAGEHLKALTNLQLELLLTKTYLEESILCNYTLRVLQMA